MRRVVLCVLSCCVLASLAVFGSPALAAGANADYPQRKARVWYTSRCCYRRIVRDVTAVRYVRIKRSYRPDRSRAYWSYRDRRPWRDGPPPYDPGYGSWLGAGWRYANYLPPPDCRLVRLTDGTGGWLWARRAGCL